MNTSAATGLRTDINTPEIIDVAGRAHAAGFPIWYDRRKEVLQASIFLFGGSRGELPLLPSDREVAPVGVWGVMHSSQEDKAKKLTWQMEQIEAGGLGVVFGLYQKKKNDGWWGLGLRST